MAGAGTNFLEFWVKFFILGGAGINLDFWSGVWSLDFYLGRKSARVGRAGTRFLDLGVGLLAKC